MLIRKIKSQLEAWIGNSSHKSIAVKFVLIALATIIPAGNTMAQRMLDLKPNSQKQSEQNYNLLNEDWVWKYYQEFNADYDDPFDTSGENKCSDIYVNVGFSGTTVIDGVEYKNCTIWRDGEKPADSDAPVIAYLREEGNKIYMRDVKPGKGLYKTLFEDYGISLNPYICPSFRWASNSKSDSERLIYDFDLDKGDTLWFDDECRDDKAGLQIIGRYTGTVEGEKIDIQEYQIYDYEIGVVYCGLGAADSLLPFPCAYSDMPFTPFRLIAIHDKENNPVITMPEGGFPPSPDETGITSVNQFINSSYYDMQGRQVSKPAEGIFIRVDRMQDGSVVSRKVCMQAR